MDHIKGDWAEISRFDGTHSWSVQKLQHFHLDNLAVRVVETGRIQTPKVTVPWPKDSNTAVTSNACESGPEFMRSDKYGLNVKKSRHLVALTAIRECGENKYEVWLRLILPFYSVRCSEGFCCLGNRVCTSFLKKDGTDVLATSNQLSPVRILAVFKLIALLLHTVQFICYE